MEALSVYLELLVIVLWMSVYIPITVLTVLPHSLSNKSYTDVSWLTPNKREITLRRKEQVKYLAET